VTALALPLALPDPAALQQVMRTPWQVSDEQWPAVSAPLEPAVVVAGAGSGKTTLMAARVVYLVATGQVRPDQVLGLTFTTKAAAELGTDIRSALERADLLPPPGAEEERLEPVTATYNAYAASLLTEHGLRIGHEPDTRLMADASRYQLAGRAVARYTRAVEHLTESPRHVIDYLLGLEGALSEHLLTTDDVRAFHTRERPLLEESLAAERAKKDLAGVLAKIAEREELLGLVDEYRALKHRLGVMDFSDQIALAAGLATEFPDVGAAERDRYAVVLLDEYQDTSVAQARMLGGLFSGPSAQQGRGHAVTAVGDPYQAIYGWRGASVSNILQIGRTFPRADGSPEVPRYSLTVSRRCDRRVLEVANAVAAGLEPARDEGDAPPVARLRPAGPAGPGRVEVSLHESLAHELARLSGRVREAATAAAAARGEQGEGWRHVGVLTRDNATAAEAFDALTAEGVPVEIVGLAGLLRLPEVAEVVATLTLLQDLTANADLLTLLTGPRWAVGARDLALLGRRARELAGSETPVAAGPLVEELERATAGADPAELLSLSDALEDPGDHPYSAAARERFGLLAAELRMLRRHAGEPLLDLVRLIVDTTGIDVELSASTSPAAAARRDNLDLFVRAVADFQAVDGDVSLASLLAYLTAEDELGTGLDVATPTEADSVKLLTVHRAKGLEWDAVFVVGVSEKKFPTERTRSTWLTGSWVVPAPLRGDAPDLPQLGERRSKQGIDAFKAEIRRHEALEERRLAYVAFTRARHLLSVSSHWRRHRGRMIGPSEYQLAVREAVLGWGEEVGPWAGEPGEDWAEDAAVPVPWPVTERTTEALRRLEAAELVREADPAAGDPDLDMESAALVAEWDAEIDRLVAEARRGAADVVEVPLPSSLSATALARLRDDPEAFAADLARPMPRPPSPAARFGTRFHAWVESRFGQQGLIDPDELPGRADAGIDDDADLARVVAAFESGPFGDRVPYRVEAPFAVVLAGQVVRGRIDAVYRESDDRWLVVDWKTNRAATADPLQLAVYRLAWAELVGAPPGHVRAAFHYVRTGETVEPDGLADRAALEDLLAP
jgi:DNA helicase-2/ATP-dependent DNA helicase PcrA